MFFHDADAERAEHVSIKLRAGVKIGNNDADMVEHCQAASLNCSAASLARMASRSRSSIGYGRTPSWRYPSK